MPSTLQLVVSWKTLFETLWPLVHAPCRWRCRSGWRTPRLGRWIHFSLCGSATWLDRVSVFQQVRKQPFLQKNHNSVETYPKWKETTKKEGNHFSLNHDYGRKGFFWMSLLRFPAWYLVFFLMPILKKQVEECWTDICSIYIYEAWRRTNGYIITFPNTNQTSASCWTPTSWFSKSSTRYPQTVLFPCVHCTGALVALPPLSI